MNLEHAKVKDLMTFHPATLSPNDSLDVAHSVMQLGRIRHVPVVDDDEKLVGVLSDRDVSKGAFFRAIDLGPREETRILERIRVSDVMSNCVLQVDPSVSVERAAGIMNRHKISCLPVVSDESLVGVLTERDFVVALTRHVESSEQENTAPSEGSWTWDTLEEEFERLRTLRDELRVQLRLATMEARDGFEEAEKRWASLEAKLRTVRKSGSESVEDAVRVGRNFVRQTRMLYEDLKGKVRD